MVGNPYRWKAAIPVLENRNATAATNSLYLKVANTEEFIFSGCLLALLFITPYLAKSGRVGIYSLACVVFIYVTLIVPMMTGILSRKKVLAIARLIIVPLCQLEQWKFFFQQILFLVRWAHLVYLDVTGIHTTVMQVVFNMAAERILCPEQRLCSLYVLLFYSVLAYLQRALQARPWAHLLNESSTAEFLKLTTAFIIVRLGKGVAMSLVLLTFTLQFNNMEPSLQFVFLTFTYFCLTQYQKNELITTVLAQWLKRLQLYSLEELEELWVPIFLSTSIIGLSTILAVLCILTTDSSIVFLILSYTNIVVPFTILWRDQWYALQKERCSISRFPMASWKNPEILSGGLCAVCLDKLRILSARVTNCGHVFHGTCLRLCLRYSSRCPLCKSIL